jgi:hypothetical protein
MSRRTNLYSLTFVSRPVVTCIELTALTAAHAIVIRAMNFDKLLLYPFVENMDGVHSYKRVKTLGSYQIAIVVLLKHCGSFRFVDVKDSNI